MNTDNNVAEIDLPEESLSQNTPHSDTAGQAFIILYLDITGPAQNLDIKSLTADHGGVLVEVSGNTVAARFPEIKEALKSAVNIHCEILADNAKRNDDHTIKAKIGIHSANHFFQGIGQSEAIMIASRLAARAGASQIFVSQSVYDLLKDFPSIRLEAVPARNREIAYGEPTAYSIIWDDTIDEGLSKIVVLCVRPLWNLSGAYFRELWYAMIENGTSLWVAKGGKVKINEDGTIFMTLHNEEHTLSIAREILRYLREGIQENDTMPFIPVNVFIYTKLHRENYEVHPEYQDLPDTGIEPGNAYIADDTLRLFQDQIKASDATVLKGNSGLLWTRVVFDAQSNNCEEEDFLYREALAGGMGEICFYCGSRRHGAAGCPSKDLPEITHGMAKLGYLSIEELNSLFFRYISAESIDSRKFYREIKEGLNSPLNHAMYGYYDLNRIVQLRFLRIVWHSKSNEWRRVRESRSINEGGPIWLALDSLRVSNLSRAESILRDALLKNPDDCRIYCALGLIHIEKGRPSDAEYFLKKSLKCSRTIIHKIFILFLLSRLYKVLGDPASAHRQIGEILAIDPGCTDALYQDIAFKLHQGKEDAAMQRLVKLIEGHKEFFVHALIDPDMTPYSRALTNQLKIILGGTREKAESTITAADEEMENSRHLLTKKELEEIEDLRLKTGKEIASKSYAGYLDAERHGTQIITICRNGVKERKKEIHELLEGLSHRVLKNLAFIDGYAIQRLVDTYRAKLERIRERIEGTGDLSQRTIRDGFAAYRLMGEHLSGELDRIESRLQRLDVMRQVMLNTFIFLKKSIILMALVLIIGIFIFPAALHYINISLEKSGSIAVSDIWIFQKYFIIIGIGVSLAVSFYITTKNFSKTGTHSRRHKRFKRWPRS